MLHAVIGRVWHDGGGLQVVQPAQHVRDRHLIEVPAKQGFERQGVQGLHVFFARTHRSLGVRGLNLINLFN